MKIDGIESPPTSSWSSTGLPDTHTNRFRDALFMLLFSCSFTSTMNSTLTAAVPASSQRLRSSRSDHRGDPNPTRIFARIAGVDSQGATTYVVSEIGQMCGTPVLDIVLCRQLHLVHLRRRRPIHSRVEPDFLKSELGSQTRGPVGGDLSDASGIHSNLDCSRVDG